MPIKASSARQIEALIADLSSDSAGAREAAVARLALAGPRAVDRLLLSLDSNAAPDARAAALRALEAIGDARVLDRVLEEVDAADTRVASAAISAARVFLSGDRGAAVVDRLTRAILDRSRDAAVRIAALRALDELEPATIAPLLEAVRQDPNDALRGALRLDSADPIAVLTETAERGLPDDPDELADALARAASGVPLPLLLRIVERVREREPSVPEARRAEWTRVRGRAHLALASRGSRIAFYDLRESFAAASSALPVEFLAALHAAGDASCLDAMAAAYARSASPGSSALTGESWWRDRLADAFRAVARRERLTRRHAAITRIVKRWGPAVDDLVSTL